ncbi:MAG: DUF3596 domain-containing protein [Desulfobacteraceae bacterium]|nr:DUF3596 domain-containing protein [Desulfobacteraceae bacterium]
MRTAIALEEEVGLPERQSGRVTRKRDSKKLYVDFFYNGVRIEKSTGLDDTPKNWQVARQWLDRQMEKMANRTFRFAEAFPGASDEEKAFHAAREGWEYRPEPQDVLFENYVASWRSSILANATSIMKQRDWNSYIDCRIIPYFGKMTFHQIHAVEVQRFLAQLKHRKGKKKGEPLSRSRVNNVLIPLRAIWSDACEENHWDLPDPFRFVKKHLPEGGKKHPEGFRFDEWMKVVEKIDPYYLPHIETMIMTGMIASELAGFRKNDIVSGELDIKNSITLGHEKEELKTKYRKRRIPITAALQKRIDVLTACSKDKYLFTMKNGLPFENYSFREHIWGKALKMAGVKYRPPYSLRHSHAAWALTIGTDLNRLVYRMGHGSKQMVFEVYGSYIPGIEDDKEKIREYFGEDFK